MYERIRHRAIATISGRYMQWIDKRWDRTKAYDAIVFGKGF